MNTLKSDNSEACKVEVDCLEDLESDKKRISWYERESEWVC